jgi:hypothetical protein
VSVVLHVLLALALIMVPRTFFAMLVLVALTTTMLTTPLLSLVLGGREVNELVPRAEAGTEPALAGE